MPNLLATCGLAPAIQLAREGPFWGMQHAVQHQEAARGPMVEAYWSPPTPLVLEGMRCLSPQGQGDG
eukprot:14211162-Alexandrium_andersonii.AAC.1